MRATRNAGEAKFGRVDDAAMASIGDAVVDDQLADHVRRVDRSVGYHFGHIGAASTSLRTIARGTAVAPLVPGRAGLGLIGH